jgi:hypothetical protein
VTKRYIASELNSRDSFVYIESAWRKISKRVKRRLKWEKMAAKRWLICMLNRSVESWMIVKRTPIFDINFVADTRNEIAFFQNDLLFNELDLFGPVEFSFSVSTGASITSPSAYDFKGFEGARVQVAGSKCFI